MSHQGLRRNAKLADENCRGGKVRNVGNEARRCGAAVVFSRRLPRRVAIVNNATDC
ncbi:hypothetical protein GHT06_014077 [Daphnia sinensis]|uniref:Uncharacterized protein n=1 Tax=Daphnia sinensis TaxID=1820382 RepID=A0AAD5KT74_9CRUS|nr:hypothetical protein GHT06_014077 [Daphnia sinensis]